MATEESLVEAVMQAAGKAAKVAIMMVREADNLVKNARPIHIIPRSSGKVLRQPMFDLKDTNKYQEPCNFEIQVKNIFINNSYSKHERNRV